MNNRQNREQRTVTIMIRMYCRAHHGGAESPCAECAELARYAFERIERCRFGVDKPACSHCSTHCFKPDLRTRIRSVMRYAGPRMIFRHPLLALQHMRDARRRKRLSGKTNNH